MELVHGRDAAFPGNLNGYKGVILGYYGGPRAYNVWTAEEWDQFPHNPKIPIWVGGLGGQPEGREAVNALRALGVPPHAITILDMETRVDKTYVAAFGAELHKASYKTWVYGSAGTLFHNPELNGYAVADPTGAVHMYPHPGVRMTQYAFGTKYDSDVIREWVAVKDTLWT